MYLKDDVFAYFDVNLHMYTRSTMFCIVYHDIRLMCTPTRYHNHAIVSLFFNSFSKFVKSKICPQSLDSSICTYMNFNTHINWHHVNPLFFS